MPNRHSVRFLLFLFLLILSISFVGCSDDDEDVVGPGDTGSVGGTGDVYVTTDPAIIDIPWVLTVPGSGTVTGVNDYQLNNRGTGDYTMSWPEIAGFNEPRPSTVEQTLGSGSNLLFSAIYLPQPGTAVISTVPAGLDASWVLEDSDDIIASSFGDTIITDLVPGNYTMSWLPVEGFDTPAGAGASLNALGPMVLTGNYTFADSMMLINPTPLDLDAPWTLTGDNSFSLSGTGQTKIDVTFDGSYTITWLDVDSRITPAAETKFIRREDGTSFSFSADYRPAGGIVNLVATINGTEMPWSLTSSTGGIQYGAGDAQFDGIPPGPCNIAWLALDGWTPGASEELELPVGGSITFTASPAAAVTVRPLPADLYASWQLSGPGGYELDGNGEMLVEGLTAGSYTITWTSVDGWTAATASSQTLAADRGLLFEGTYSQTAQTLQVNPLPVALDISWTITGPGGFSQAGSGLAAFPITETGQYTVVWGDEAGYMRPGADQLDYNGEGNLNFRADYQELLDLVSINVGSFVMGSPGSESCRNGLERRHSVNLTHDFVMKSTEVTNAEFIAMAQWAMDRGYATANEYGINDNLDGSTEELLDLDDGDQEIFFENGVLRCIRPDHPVKEVSWYGAVSYCDWLSMYRGIERSYNHATWVCGTSHPSQAFGFRLPTESEWEYSCRAGTTTAFYNGTIFGYTTCSSSFLPDAGWYDVNGDGWSHEVGQLDPNSYGLYDTHGNVAEWCNDWYDDTYYTYLIDNGPVDNPQGPISADQRVVRGGYFYSPVEDCRSAARNGLEASNASYNTGFRVVITGS